MPNDFIPSRRRLVMLASAALGTSLVGGIGRLAFADDDDSDNHFADSANTSFTLANTGLKARVVVVGGGMAGATVAKYLRLWGGSGVQVTLVEPNARYTSNIMSNLVLNGSRNISTLGYTYASLSAKYGVAVKQARLSAINAAAKSVTLSDGTSLPYDRLVLAPGVEFMDAYGITQNDYATATPHAWQAGPQTSLLATQLAGMSNGTFVMTIPKAPYRCPPGPYERACLVADYLKTYRGSASRVIVLDENATIQAEKETFNHAFTSIHASVITYVPGATDIRIDPATRQVRYLDVVGAPQTINAQVVAPIPP
ncbi:MAG: NAD(P)/FAD-dependent oxidoreductase, partial [Burkholderiaceae bacterium]